VLWGDTVTGDTRHCLRAWYCTAACRREGRDRAGHSDYRVSVKTLQQYCHYFIKQNLQFLQFLTVRLLQHGSVSISRNVVLRVPQMMDIAELRKWMYTICFHIMYMDYYCLYALFCIFCFHCANSHSPTTLTEVFPCFFLGCKANARVYLPKTGHGSHSS